MKEPIRSRAALKQENAELLNLAAQESLRRSAAEDAAIMETAQRTQAENAAVDARIAANQAAFQAAQLNTERELLRDNLAAERKSASNANFGLMLFSAIALVGLLAFGIYAATNRGNHPASNNASAPMREAQAEAIATGRPATVTSPAPSRPSHTEYHPAAPMRQNTAAQPQPKAKTAPAAAAHPSRTPSADAMDSNSDTSGDEEADSADSDSNSDSHDSATRSDKSTDKSSDDKNSDESGASSGK